MSRNAFIRSNGDVARIFSTPATEFAASTAVTTSPRLTDRRPATNAEIEYQLINAKPIPTSFTPTHVPPPGSDGNKARLPPAFRIAGARARTRASFSSRFMPNA